jgi:phosphopantetheinyl transferase
MGRVALKEVVRRWIADKTGRRLYPADIVIETDDYGRPYVTGEWEYDLIEAPEVSLAHSGGYSFAAAGRAGMPVGVDMEWPGRVKEPQLVAEYFSPVEQTYLAHLASADFETGMLRIWCAKEAAAKCIGVGLDGRVDEFIVDVNGINESSVHVFYKNTQLRVHLGEYQGAFLSLASIMDDYSYHHAIQ